MSKRLNSYERKPRDFYETPYKGVLPLVEHLPSGQFTFLEPCAGSGKLVNHLTKATEGKATCVAAYDIEPQSPTVSKANTL